MSRDVEPTRLRDAAPWGERLALLRSARGIELLEAGDLRAFESAVRARRPVLVRGAVRHWRALAWSPASLREHHGDLSLNAYRIDRGHLVLDGRRGLVEERVSFGDVLGALGDDGALRVRARLAPYHRLSEDAPPPPHCVGRLRLEANLWVSPAETVSRLHFDQPEGLLCQVLGRKRVLVVAPSQRRRLYPFAPWSSNAQFSRIDFVAPELQRFPELRAVQGTVADLAPGDALFLPGGYWHYVEAEDVTISIGFRWWRTADLPRLILGDVYKRLRGHTR